ncbi:hypothetical protein OPQ81_002958 [Rhizoctonia solani]|nr:hypothetical protein OPQ81_002958 [Rhizoctonia solani]
MDTEEQDRQTSDTASTLSRLITDTETMPSMTNDGYTETGTDGRVSPAPSLYSLTPSLRDQSFRHIHGRSLNAHSEVYSLPADQEEAQRLYKQHRLFYLLARNDHYYGITDLVREVLAPTGERQRMVLDLGCGPGAWTVQCAIDFPHVEVLGVDLAPTSAIAPPPNCRFEIDDLNLGLEHFFGPTFDIVHARLLNSGLHVLTQWAVPTWMATMSKCVRAKGGNIDAAALLKTWLREHPNYEDVRPSDLWAPLGPWKATQPNDWTQHPNFPITGEMSRDNLIDLMSGARPLLYGWFSHDEVAALEEAATRERLNITTRSMSQHAQVDLSIGTLFGVKGKIALVTGGGSGIGFMIASALVQNGAKVYIASRKEKQLQEAQKALNEKGPGRCEYIVADLGSKAGCDALCDAFKKRESKLHILVNNSGATWGAPWENFPEREGWDRVMALNVKSLFYMTSGLSELLQKDATALDPGRVVNISSVAGNDPIAQDTGLANKGQGLWSYNTSKAAVNHLTTTMAVTLAPKFITVNAILPGVYPSKMTAFGFSKAADALAKSHPMGRVGAPTDMAGLFLFLVSPGGAHITGAHIESDGGSRISGRGYRLSAPKLALKMSDHTDDEYEFTEFTEDELHAIDLTVEAALGAVWPPSDHQLAACSDTVEAEGSLPYPRKSSVSSTFELTEEELQSIDQCVAHLISDLDSGSGAGSQSEVQTQLMRPQLSHLGVSIELPVDSTLVGSPVPTLGRSPSPSPPEMASLYSKFRASRNSLSVSDLVGPVWCEVQFDYGLRGKRHLPPSLRPKVLESRSGKKIQVQREVAVKNDRVLKKGTAVHKKLEREIRPIEVEITPKTPEDTWGLKLLNMISNIRILIDEGCCREMPVMGFVHGHFVTGIIDEILRTPEVSQLAASKESSSQKLPSSSGSKDIIQILDNKTRGTNSLPRSRDTLQSRLQLMLYRRLLDKLLVPSCLVSANEGPTSRRLSFPEVWVHHSLDPAACFSPSFLQESAALVFSNGLGSAAENAVCLNDLEDVWKATVDELVHTFGPGEQSSMISKVLKLVYQRRGVSKKRPDYADENSQGKKGRPDSEDVELQRAIHESLRHGVRSDDLTLQDETSEVMGRQRKDESLGLMQETGDAVCAPGGWISSEDDLRRPIDESKKSYYKRVGREALSPSPPLLPFESKRKRESRKEVIGVVEFEHDDVLLDAHLSDVLDFWHDRRPPRGVDLEDTGRCRYCEFSEGCEWLEAKAKEIAQGTTKRK